MTNTNKLTEPDPDLPPPSPDFDMDDVAEQVLIRFRSISKGSNYLNYCQVEDAIDTAEQLARRLDELNKEMIKYMFDYAQAKASNK